MNLTVKLYNLKTIVGLVAIVTPTRTTLPSLGAVLLAYDDCVLTASTTDLKSFARAHCDAMGEQSGAFGVRADLLASFLGGCTAESVEITVADRATFVCGSSKANLAVVPLDQFQAHPEVAGDPVKLSAPELHSALSRVLHAASDDALKMGGILCSVLFDFSESLNLVGYSGYQVAVCNLLVHGSGQHIVPRDTISALLKLSADCKGDIAVTFGEKLVKFECDQWSLSGVMFNGKFPPWRTIKEWSDMPKFVFKRDDLVGAVRNCMPFGEAGFVRIRMECKTDRAVIEIAGQNEALSEIPMQGGEVTVFFEGKKMLAMLGSLTADEVTLEYKDEPGKGIVIHENNFTAALMPLGK